jgi:hypothetical protein
MGVVPEKLAFCDGGGRRGKTARVSNVTFSCATGQENDARAIPTLVLGMIGRPGFR